MFFARERYTANKENELNTILYLQVESERGTVIAGHIDVRSSNSYLSHYGAIICS